VVWQWEVNLSDSGRAQTLQLREEGLRDSDALMSEVLLYDALTFLLLQSVVGETVQIREEGSDARGGPREER
jgi:hypothetical protein